jgi:hypothetical protein
VKAARRGAITRTLHESYRSHSEFTARRPLGGAETHAGDRHLPERRERCDGCDRPAENVIPPSFERRPHLPENREALPPGELNHAMVGPRPIFLSTSSIDLSTRRPIPFPAKSVYAIDGGVLADWPDDTELHFLRPGRAAEHARWSGRDERLPASSRIGLPNPAIEPKGVNISAERESGMEAGSPAQRLA